MLPLLEQNGRDKSDFLKSFSVGQGVQNAEQKKATSLHCGRPQGQDASLAHIIIAIEGKGRAYVLLGRETAIEGLSQEDIFHKFKPCFEGLGMLKDFQLDINIDGNIKPVS